MFRLSTIILLVLFISTSSKSDSVYDLDLEGIKLGESVFKYISEKQIIDDQKKIISKYKSDRYKRVRYLKEYGYSGNLYDQVGFHYDKNGKIGAISGGIFMTGKTIDQCIGRSLSIIDDIKQKINFPIKGSPTKILNTSFGQETISKFQLDNGSIDVRCSFPKEKKWTTSLKINLFSRDFQNWLTYEAHK